MADYSGSFFGSFQGTISGSLLGSEIVSGSSQINFNNIVNKPTTIQLFQANAIISNNRFREVTFPAFSSSVSTDLISLESNVSTLSGQIQAAVSGTVPPGTISSSNQLFVLNIFTSSIQTQVDNLTEETSSYILVSQTSSMSVLSAVTASYISPTFISASVAAFGFGGINLQQTTDLGSLTTNAITASAFSGSKIVLSDSSITPSPIAGGIFYSSSNFYFGFDA